MTNGKDRVRIFLTGVGGQGTLTATNFLARVALKAGLTVTAGEIHGMAQRGGVVESTLLIGGWQSPKLTHGEADVLLGFEPLETLRALPYLRQGGIVVSSTDPIAPVAVALGQAAYPELDDIKRETEACASRAHFLPIRKIGRKAGALQAGNLALMGAACALGVLPLTVDDLKDGVASFLPPKIRAVNEAAIDLGAKATAA